MTLSAPLGALMAILQAHPLCLGIAEVETKEFSPQQLLFKIRAVMGREHHFQVRIYHNHGYVDYAYQLFTDQPVLRWTTKRSSPACQLSAPFSRSARPGETIASERRTAE